MNVFDGPDAVLEFMDPGKQPPIALVELPASLNPFAKDKVRIFAKTMYLSPLLNLKLLPALEMLLQARAAGKLKGVHTLVEASSGNTVFSLAILAPLFGVKRVTAIVPADIAAGKLGLLRLSGAHLLLHKDVPGGESGIMRARRMGKKKGFLNLAQYENVANPKAHEQWTAEQVWKQTKGKVSVFCAGMGTTGTIVGARDCFRKKRAKVAIVGVVSAPETAVPGVRTEVRLKEIVFDWTDSIHRVEIGTKESFQKSIALCRAGLMAGPSSGFALAGLLKFLKAQKRDPSSWKKLRNKDGEMIAVVVLGDTPFPYLDKYPSF